MIKDLSPAAIDDIFDRFDEDALTKEDRPVVRAMMEGYVLLGKAVNEKNGHIHKLLRMIFGSKTEKASTIIPELKKMTRTKKKAKGHGKNGASSYTGSEKVTVSHPSLKKGDHCPECEKGKVYPVEPGVIGAGHWERAPYGNIL